MPGWTHSAFQIDGGLQMIEQYIRQVREFSHLSPVVSLEIGALDGEYSRVLKKSFQLNDQDIYLVEPNPDLQDGLEEVLPKSNRLQVAVSDFEGDVQFNRVLSLEKNKLGCSSLRERTDDYREFLQYSRVAVRTITGRSLLKQIARPVDLCIVDVEGCAYEAIASFGDQIGMVKSIMVECEHAPIFEGQRLYKDVAVLLGSHGFRLMAFQYSYANQSDSIWINEQHVRFVE